MALSLSSRKGFHRRIKQIKETPTASPHYYHADIQCIRRRHENWNATTHNLKYSAVDDVAILFIKSLFGLNED